MLGEEHSTVLSVSESLNWGNSAGPSGPLRHSHEASSWLAAGTHRSGVGSSDFFIA